MTTKIPAELSSTPGIVDNSDATAITIASDEKVGIGETSPQFQMLTVKSSSATGNNLRLVTGSELAVLSVDDAGDLQINAHGADERIKFLNGVGSGTVLAAFDSDGLKFGSDTAAANALDDYEEGTWTPTAPQTTALAALYGARYIKIGNMVHAKCYIAFTPANNTTTFTIEGLPYTALNVTDYGQGSVGYVNQSNINNLCDPIVNPNTNTIYFYYNDGTTGGSSVKNNFWHTATSGGNQLIIISVLYQTA